MGVRTTFVDKWNYTNRKRIKQKPELFRVEQVGRTSANLSIRVWWDEAEILREARVDPSQERQLVLDAMVLGTTTRFELSPGGEAEEFVIEECPDSAAPEFRLKLVSKEPTEMGVLLAATSPFKLKTGPGPNDGAFVTSGFFHPELSDSLGSRIWAVSWPAPDQPVISLNRSYFEKSKDKPYFAAHLYPEILRAVVTGILLRNNDLGNVEEHSPADEWITFVEAVLETPLRGEDAGLGTEVDDRLDVVETIVSVFADRKWRNGKTLLEELI